MLKRVKIQHKTHRWAVYVPFKGWRWVSKTKPKRKRT